MSWIDAHCHLADARFDGRLDEVLDRSRARGVTAWIQGGIDAEDWARQKALRGKHGPGIVLSFGIHPWWAAKMKPMTLAPALEALDADLGNAQLVGELGLDYGPRHREASGTQKAVFREQLRLARKHGKPVALHIVHAHEDALAVLSEEKPHSGGWVHLYTGSFELARRYIDLGFMISVGGPVARAKGYETLKRGLARIPGDALILETDSPDQSPDELPNEPARLVEIAQAAAALRNEDWRELLDRSARNISSLLKIEH